MVKFNPITFTDLKIIDRRDPETKEVIHREFEEFEVSLSLKDYIKEQIPTARFWLMLKLKDEVSWSRKWNDYIKNVHKFLRNQFEGPSKEIETHIRQATEKLERSAWNTMPSSFLSMVGIPRAIRR